MRDGRIVRLGALSLDKLKDNYADYITVDGIVARKSAELNERKSRVQQAIDRINAQSENARQVLDRFHRLDNLRALVKAQDEAVRSLATQDRDLRRHQETVVAKITKLEEELAHPKKGFRGWFGRKDDIKKSLSDQMAQFEKLCLESEITGKSYADAKRQLDSTLKQRAALERELNMQDREKVELDLSRADAIRAPLVEELLDVDTELADIRAAVLKNAAILGATCAKTYMSAKEIGQLDMVIVDEASMVLLPVVWFVASRATERVVICGDFRQIPPIVPTREEVLFQELGHDVFKAVGIDPKTSHDPRLVTLTVQYRMHDSICDLISRPMYQGKLVTDPALRQSSAAMKMMRAPFDNVLTIIDTSDLWPFESVNPFFSRFNLMHALLVRNLVWHLGRTGYFEGNCGFGICSPYSAQAKMIQKLIEGEANGKEVQVSTVHSFQGDERTAVLLEVPESYGGGKMVGQFLQGSWPESTGSRLINVAVSRAQRQFLVLANLTYLDRMLPSLSFLRHVLYEMQGRGRIISGKEVLALRPIEDDLRGIIGHVNLEPDERTFGLFDGPGFERAVKMDITNATESVALFSGFITPTRVGAIGDLLRQKIRDGVKIRCVTRPPHLNGSVDPRLGEQALDMLANIGCVVDCRSRIHEKVIVIDKEIVWHGSLNILSHNHRTDESMTRLIGAGFAEQVATHMSKRSFSSAAALQNISIAENPVCGSCGARTYHDEGKFGPYYRCEKKCGWTLSLKKVRHDLRNEAQFKSDLPSQGPACPICSGATRLRSGRFGQFYGCERYPTCPGKVKPLSALNEVQNTKVKVRSEQGKVRRNVSNE